MLLNHATTFQRFEQAMNAPFTHFECARKIGESHAFFRNDQQIEQAESGSTIGAGTSRIPLVTGSFSNRSPF